MNIRLKLVVVVAASAASLLAIRRYGWAQTKGNAEAEQQVRKVEEERRQAILRNGIKSLGLLMAPEHTAIFNAADGVEERRHTP